METLNIDRASKQPVFKQIYDILMAEMKGGLYLAQGKLPSEKELCARFDVERNTVRKALQILVDERRITRIPGVGTQIMPLSGEGPAAGPEKTEEPLLAPDNPRPLETGGSSRIILLITQIDYLHSVGGGEFPLQADPPL
jgi:DNA-binding transcriptional regulator YhcF (GntR family)